MPFANLNLPSIALTQIKAVLDRTFTNLVRSDIFHLNHDFAALFGLETYSEIANSIGALNAGVGDWIFRQAAFPELTDNLQTYFKRYFPQNNERTRHTRELIANARAGLDGHIEKVIDACRLDEYDVVGFTSMFSQNVSALAVARHLKERNPGIIIIFGGAN